MKKFVIQGPCKLSGEVNISGSKNAALQLIPAALLADEVSIIKNVPDILDIRNLLSIIEDLGGKVDFKDNTLSIDPTSINSFKPSPSLVGKLRASILLAVPLLVKFGQVQIPYPGGCFIGKRPLNFHFDAFKALGIKVGEENSYYKIEAKDIIGTNININFSVLGTGNALMACVFAKGESTIKLAAAEPEILNLIDFLNKMGADIRWTGNHILKIKGVTKLKGAQIETIPDRIEGGTFALAGVASNGDLLVKNFVPDHNDAFLSKLKEINAKFDLGPDYIHIKKGTALYSTNLKTNIFPGFPTDLQAPFAIVLTQSEGIGEIFETIYEGRLSYLYELEKMGAKVTIHNSHSAIIDGPTPLYGKKIESLDLRAGATLIIASIVAHGESTITRAEIIDRGYEMIEKKLLNIGADITSINLSPTPLY